MSGLTSTHNGRFHRLREAGLVVLLGAGLGLVTAQVANAYALTGCKYTAASIEPIVFRFYSVDATLVTRTKYGTNSWNTTSAPGTFQESTTDLDPEVNVTQFNDSNSRYYAMTTWACVGGVYDGNETNYKWNTAIVYTRTETQQKRIAVHEFGHVYGLDHVSSLCRIMRTDIGYMTDCPNLVSPAGDDISGVDAIY